MSYPTIAIVGSGPIGATYARTLLEGLPDARVIMFEAGPQITDRPGESVRNIADPDAKARARELSQGPQAGDHREALGIPSATVVEGMFTARQGTHLFDFGGAGSAHAPTFAAAAGATKVGGLIGAGVAAGLPASLDAATLTPAAVHAASPAVQAQVADLYSSVMAPIFIGLAVAYAIGILASLLLPDGRLSDQLEPTVTRAAEAAAA